MATLADVAEKLGELRAEVRDSRDDMASLKVDVGGLSGRLGAVEEQIRTRRAKERLLWSIVTAVGVASWGAIGLVPWRIWAAVIAALGQ